MKRILFTISAVMLAATASMAQTPTITNGTYEAWVAPSGLYQLERPTAWYATDDVLDNQVGPFLIISGMPFTPQKQLYKSADKYEGDYCAKIMTKNFGDTLKAVPALFTNAKPNLNLVAFLQAQNGGNVNPMDLFTYTNGTPMYGKRADSVTAYINAPASNHDTGLAFVLAYKKITADSMALIGEGFTMVPPNAGGYQKYIVPVMYNSSSNTATDTLVVGFVSAASASDTATGYYVNNTMFIDKVELFWSAGTSSLKGIPSQNLGFTVYPNPAKDYVIFEQKVTAPQRNTLVIYNTLGQVMHQETISGVQKQIDLSHYAQGTYFYEVYNEKATAKQVGKFIK
ncbi:T9SS type A sorting domain-containing protein [Edaphocola flava]|uniref:T9SS type A sorting domain-containing protein n=1 Tax=Edaphocola flava TaxID=2499629 RepID=UPI00100AC787|nr:T9SS type A sorting domain-containing protein [Edaphocola flava]